MSALHSFSDNFQMNAPRLLRLDAPKDAGADARRLITAVRHSEVIVYHVRSGEWHPSCEALVRAPTIVSKRSIRERPMKIQRHIGIGSGNPQREAEQIRTMILDLDLIVQTLDCEIAAEELRAKRFDPENATYPILAKTLTARRDNLNITIAALEKQLAGIHAALPEDIPNHAQSTGLAGLRANCPAGVAPLTDTEPTQFGTSDLKDLVKTWGRSSSERGRFRWS
jgi:hypothetical protein